VVCFNKVIIEAKRGQRSAPCASSTIGHQSIVNFFLAGFGATSGFSTTTSSTFTGSGVGSGAGAGSWNKSVNLLINPNRIL